MFCPNCGAQFPDGTEFCGNCGVQMNAQPVYQPPYAPSNAQQPYVSGYVPTNEQQSYTPGYVPANAQQPYMAPAGQGGSAPAPEKNHLPLIIGIAVAVIAVIVLAVVLWGGGDESGSGRGSSKVKVTPEDVVEEFYDALLSGDLDEALECVHPDMVDEIDGDADELIASLELIGDGIEIDVLGSELIDDDYEIEDVQNLLDDYDINEKLGDVYEVEIEIAINFMGMNQTQTDDVIVAEIGGTFYIVDMG